MWTLTGHNRKGQSYEHQKLENNMQGQERKERHKINSKETSEN